MQNMFLDKISQYKDETDLFEIVCICLIALTSTFDVIKIASVGNTPVLLPPILSLIYVAYRLIIKKADKRALNLGANKVLLIFIFYIIISGFFPFLFKISDNADMFFKSFILLISMLFVYHSIIANPSERIFNAALNGLIIGAILNSIYATYQFVGSFYNLPGININWPIAQTKLDTIQHRAPGLFREPSYLIGLLIPCIIIAICFKKRHRLIIAIIIASGMIATLSSGLAFFATSLVVFIMILFYLVLYQYRQNKDSEGKDVIRILFIVFIITCIGILILNKIPLEIAKVDEILRSASPYSETNIERVSNISKAILLSIQNPIGYGYGMGPTIMKVKYNTTKIHSLAASLLLEIGLPGFFLFLIFIFSLSFALLRNNKSYKAFSLSLAVLLTTIYSFLTYNSMFYYQWVILGLCAIYFKVGSTSRCNAEGS